MVSVALLCVYPRQPLAQVLLLVTHCRVCFLRSTRPTPWCQSHFSQCTSSAALGSSLGVSHALPCVSPRHSLETHALVSVALLCVYPRQPMAQVLVLVTHCRVCFLRSTRPTPRCQSHFSQCTSSAAPASVLVLVTHRRVCFLDKAEAHALVSVTLPRVRPRQPLPQVLVLVTHTAMCASSTQRRTTPWCKSHFSVCILGSP